MKTATPVREGETMNSGGRNQQRGRNQIEKEIEDEKLGDDIKETKKRKPNLKSEKPVKTRKIE